MLVEAEVPLSEMFGYTTELRSMSTGRASSVMEPLKYSEVPTNVKKAILEELGYKAERGSHKHRYVGLVGSTTLVKKLRKALRWRSLPYLKREIAE